MPRIATALGVWITVVVSIGFNIVRYPVVWEMMAPSAHTPVDNSAAKASQADPASNPAPSQNATSRTDAPASHAAASEVAGAPGRQNKARVQCDGNSCKLVPAEAPAPSSDASSPATSVAVEAAPAAKYAAAQPSPDPDASAPADKRSVASAPESTSLGNKTRRLPPLTQEYAPPAVEADNSPNRAIPLYATTGIQ